MDSLKPIILKPRRMSLIEMDSEEYSRRVTVTLSPGMTPPRRGAGKSKTGRVNVVCRFRPQNQKEIDNGGMNCVEYADDGQTLTFRGNAFTYDRVFNESTTQAEVYEFTAQPIVEDVLQGYNGTVFAYGQTSSGKTHTMEGASLEDEQTRGIIPRMLDTVFEFTDSLQSDPSWELILKCQFVEIYMEKVRDLLDLTRANCQITEDTTGMSVNATEITVSSKQHVLDVMRTGLANRSIAETKMNEESSRSHSIFILHVSQKNKLEFTQKKGSLFLVDLAGSEQIKKTEASGQTLEEAKRINKSLSALGNVINALTDPKASHIPYRDSKLTRLLQESLGGNARTALIVNCSPSSLHESETLSTLRFGARAKRVENKPQINKEKISGELKILLSQKEQELLESRNQLTEMKQQYESTQAELDQLQIERQVIQNQLDTNVELLEQQESHVNQLTADLAAANASIGDLRTALQVKLSELNTTQQSFGASIDVQRREMETVQQQLATATVAKEQLERKLQEAELSWNQERERMFKLELALSESKQSEQRLMEMHHKEIQTLHDRIQRLQEENTVTVKEKTFAEKDKTEFEIMRAKAEAARDSAMEMLLQFQSMHTKELREMTEQLTHTKVQLDSSVNRVGQLEQQVKESVHSAESKQNELIQLRSELDSRVQHYEAEIRGLETRLSEVRLQVEQLDKNRSERIAAEATLQQAHKRLETELLTLTQQLNQATASLQTVTVDYEAVIREKNQLQDQVSSLQTALIAVQRQVKEMSITSSELESTRQELLSQARVDRQRISDLETSLLRSDSDNAELRSKLDSYQSELALMRTSSDEHFGANSLLVQEYKAQASETICELKSQLNQAHAEIQQLLSENKSIMNRFQDSTEVKDKDTESLQIRVATLSAENKSLTERLSHLQTSKELEIKYWAEKNELTVQRTRELQTEVETILRQKDDALRRAAQSQLDMQKLEGEKSQAVAMLRELRDTQLSMDVRSQDKVASELSSLTHRLEEMQNELKQSKDDQSKLIRSNAELQERLLAAESRNAEETVKMTSSVRDEDRNAFERIMSQVGSQNQNLEKIQQDLFKLTQEREQFKQQVFELTHQLGVEQQKASSAMDQLRKVEEENRSLTDEAAEMESAISDQLVQLDSSEAEKHVILADAITISRKLLETFYDSLCITEEERFVDGLDQVSHSTLANLKVEIARYEDRYNSQRPLLIVIERRERLKIELGRFVDDPQSLLSRLFASQTPEEKVLRRELDVLTRELRHSLISWESSHGGQHFTYKGTRYLDIIDRDLEKEPGGQKYASSPASPRTSVLAPRNGSPSVGSLRGRANTHSAFASPMEHRPLHTGSFSSPNPPPLFLSNHVSDNLDPTEKLRSRSGSGTDSFVSSTPVAAVFLEEPVAETAQDTGNGS